MLEMLYSFIWTFLMNEGFLGERKCAELHEANFNHSLTSVGRIRTVIKLSINIFLMFLSY